LREEIEIKNQHAVSQNTEDKKGLGEKTEAESTDSAMDPHANGQYDPLQRQKASLEENEAQALSGLAPSTPRLLARGKMPDPFPPRRLHDCFCFNFP